MMKLKTSYSPAITVQKALKILEILADKQPARVPELAKQLNLSRSNVYRLLATLEEMHYVEKNEESKYYLSFKMFSLGNVVLEKSRLPAVAQSHMTVLANISQEVVNLGVMYQEKVLYVKKIESPHFLKFDRPVGETDPIHCTALGKVFLSGLTDQELNNFLRSIRLIPFTKKTITNPELLTKIIQDSRKRGYATDFEELSDGVHCVAAPIRDHTRKVIAAISISGPALRLTKSKINNLKEQLIEATVEISRKLGYPDFSKPA